MAQGAGYSIPIYSPLLCYIYDSHAWRVLGRHEGEALAQRSRDALVTLHGGVTVRVQNARARRRLPALALVLHRVNTSTPCSLLVTIVICPLTWSCIAIGMHSNFCTCNHGAVKDSRKCDFVWVAV